MDFQTTVGGCYSHTCGLIDGKLRANAARIRNLLKRDHHLKQAMGFDESHFTRLGEILRKIEE